MDFLEELVTSSQKSNVSPELLETLGNKAAFAFLNNKISLNDSIRSLVAENGDLNNEHVKRIVEFANNRTFKEMFEQSEDKNVHFDVADPGVVIKDLGNGGSPAHVGKPLSVGNKDYDAGPTTEKREFEDPDSAMQQLFAQENVSGQSGQGEQLQKQASVSFDSDGCVGHANPLEDVCDVRDRLHSMRDHLRGANESFDFMLKTAQEDFYQAVKYEVLCDRGLGIPGVVSALHQLGHNEELVKVAVRKTSLRLLGEGVDFDQQNGTLFAKTAGMNVPNPDHRLNVCFIGLVKIAENKHRTEVALADVNLGLARTDEFLKTASRGVK